MINTWDTRRHAGLRDVDFPNRNRWGSVAQVSLDGKIVANGIGDID
jgi:hypothetical protein